MICTKGRDVALLCGATPLLMEMQTGLQRSPCHWIVKIKPHGPNERTLLPKII